MTEMNPAAEAERLAALLVSDADKARTAIKTDAEAIKTDIENDVSKVAADVKPTETVAKTDASTVETTFKVDTTTAVDALKTAQAGVQAGVAVTDAVAEKAHGVVSNILADIEGFPSEVSDQLKEAGLKLKSALSWIEAHFTTQKKPVPTPPTPPAS